MPRRHLRQWVLGVSLVALACMPAGTPRAEDERGGLEVPTAGKKAGAGSSQSLAGRDRPNIVFILADDLDVASVAWMPNVQKLLGEQGTWFDNFLVNVSLCCPSRVTTLRGQYAHNTRVFANRPPDGGYEVFRDSGAESSTIATWLQAAGYRTLLAGKYMNGYPSAGATTVVPPGWTEWYSPVAGTPYREFEYTLNENGRLVGYGSAPEDYGTDVYGRKAVDFIRRAAADGVPFFAFVSLFAPHEPAKAAPRHQALFKRMGAPRGPAFNEADVTDKPAWVRERPLLTREQRAEIDRKYRARLRSLQAVDELVVSVMDALAAAGAQGNTYVFFSSDNGYHMGQHRLTVGKASPYEEDVHVPLIVRGPGVPAGVRLEHLAGNVDLAATWAELAGADLPEFVDGRSFVPLLESSPPPVETWRQAFYLQRGRWPWAGLRPEAAGASADPARAAPPLARQETPFVPPDLLEPEDLLIVPGMTAAQRREDAVPTFRGVHTLDYVFVEYESGRRELYDLIEDPRQLQNIADSQSGIADLLAARTAALATCAGATCRALEWESLPLPQRR